MKFDSRPQNVAQWKALIAAIGPLRRGNYPGGPSYMGHECKWLWGLFTIDCRLTVGVCGVEVCAGCGALRLPEVEQVRLRAQPGGQR